MILVSSFIKITIYFNNLISIIVGTYVYRRHYKSMFFAGIPILSTVVHFQKLAGFVSVTKCENFTILFIKLQK